MIKYYWKFYFIYIIQLLISLQQVYASIAEQRKHSTAHYFQNDTLYILGGIGLTNATEQQSLILHFDENDYSLSPLKYITYRPTIGHTSHQLIPSNSIISIFGLPLQAYQQPKDSVPPLRYIPTSTKIQNKTSSIQPNGRQYHTSTIIENKIYVIGGKSTSNTRSLIPTKEMILIYSLSSHTWNQIPTNKTTQQQLPITGMAGHVTIVYDQWLISCFGQGGLNQSCIWFDTETFKHTIVAPSQTIEEWPAARTHASMISLSPSKFLLFGGEANEVTMLDDVWQLAVHSNFSMTWKQIKTKTSYKRSGHASVLITKKKNIVLYYGGQDGPNSFATEPLYFSLINMDWIQKRDRNVVVPRQYGADLSNNAAAPNDQKKLNGGAIGGIIVGVISIVGLCIGVIVWRKRHARQQQYNKSNSRAARFSRSPSPQLQEKLEISYHRSSFNNNQSPSRDSAALSSVTQCTDGQKFLSLPELALYNNNNTKHNSYISLGRDFQFSTDDFFYGSRNSSNLGYNKKNNSSVPTIELIKSDSTKTEIQQTGQTISSEEKNQPGYSKKNTSSYSNSGFKRLTLNLFSSNTEPPSEQERQKKNRSSSLFQLRSSSLLQPNTPSTPGTPGTSDGRYPLRANLQSRVSVGAKSVASVQWVGFNEGMDHSWRHSGASSLHLAVTNAQRASSHYTSESAQSTPKSPAFPQHLRDSAIQYQRNDLENSAWKSSPELHKNSSTSVV